MSAIYPEQHITPVSPEQTLLPGQMPWDAAEYMKRNGPELHGHLFSAAEAGRNKPGRDYTEDMSYMAHDQATGTAVFGIWDGVGGHAGGVQAAKAARQALHDKFRSNPAEFTNAPGTTLERVMDAMNVAVAEAAPVGGTTGLLAVLSEKDGEKYLDWVAAGDSLGYIVRKNGKVEHLNEEETLQQYVEDNPASVHDPAISAQLKVGTGGSMLVNSLGNQFAGLNQKGRVKVEDGDRLVFVTDGITGDNPEQRMSGSNGTNVDVIGRIVDNNFLTPAEKAERLVEAATKTDDRRAIVVQVGKPHYTDAQPHEDAGTAGGYKIQPETQPIQQRPSEMSAAIDTLYRDRGMSSRMLGFASAHGADTEFSPKPFNQEDFVYSEKPFNTQEVLGLVRTTNGNYGVLRVGYLVDGTTTVKSAMVLVKLGEELKSKAEIVGAFEEGGLTVDEESDDPNKKHGTTPFMIGFADKKIFVRSLGIHPVELLIPENEVDKTHQAQVSVNGLRAAIGKPADKDSQKSSYPVSTRIGDAWSVPPKEMVAYLSTSQQPNRNL